MLLIRSEEHTSELQSHSHLVCRLLLEKKKKIQTITTHTPTKECEHTSRHVAVRNPLSSPLPRVRGLHHVYIPAGSVFVFFFFNDTATTEIYTLSLHDALPI